MCKLAIKIIKVYLIFLTAKSGHEEHLKALNPTSEEMLSAKSS
jgi:hypothetical protein